MSRQEVQNRRSFHLLGSLLAVCLLVAGSLPTRAEIGTVDDVPAATLLLPYFEVDLDDPQGVNTMFTVSNAVAGPAILNVTLWSDWSVPTLTFGAYLTGYDVMDVDLRSLFTSGSLPPTSHQNPAISNVGDYSYVNNPNTGVGPGSSSCDVILPLPPLPNALLSHIQNAHTGEASAIFGGNCSGLNQGDDIARGYITIDNVSECTLLFPTDPGYFVDGGTGVATNSNVLLGSYRIIESRGGLAHGGAMVHVEASSEDRRTAPGRYTFYSRYSGGADNREPLASAVAAPYVQEETDFLYWRDSHFGQNPIFCGTTPSWFPLKNHQIVLFDQEENPEIPTGGPFSPPIGPLFLDPFVAEAGRVTVGSEDLPANFERGWAYLNLATRNGSALDPIAQGWVGVVERDPSGLFATSPPAWQLFNSSENENVVLPCVGNFPSPLCGVVDGIFADGFETGNLDAWAEVVP